MCGTPIARITGSASWLRIFFFSPHTFTSQLLDKPWSQVSSLLPPNSCLLFLSHIIRFSNPTARRFFHRVLLLTHALALSAIRFVHKKKSQRIYTSMHSAGLELTKLTYTRLEDNLIRHRGDIDRSATPLGTTGSVACTRVNRVMLNVT